MVESDKQQTGSGAERRTSERLTVDLPARVDLNGRDPRSARIMDCCAGGVFLTVEGQEDDYLVLAARQIGRDDQLRVTFDADPGDGLRTFTIGVKVARLFLGGMGVAFEPPEPDAVRALQLVADRSRSAAVASGTSAPQQQGPSGSPELLSDVHQRVQRWLRESLDGQFKCAVDELFIEARDAPNNDLQSRAMDALKDVERVQISVRDAASARVLRALERLSATGSSSVATVMDEADDERGGGGGGLALVDTGSFDDWVTTKNIITRHEPTLREAAYGLSRRLEVVSGKRVDELANPLGLQQLGSAFNEAMQNIGLPRRPRQAIYHAFEESLIPALRKLHEQLNNLLIERGILPQVERPSHGAPRRTPTQRPRPAAESAASEPADNADAMQPAYESGQAVAPSSGQRAHHPGGGGQSAGAAGEPAGHQHVPQDTSGVNPWAAAPLDGGHDNVAAGGVGATLEAGAPSTSPAAAPGAPGEAHGGLPPGAGQSFQPTYHSPIQPAVTQVGMERAYHAARNLMGMQRAMTSGSAMAGVSHASAHTPAQQPSGSSSGLIDALSKMQTSSEFSQPPAHDTASATSPLKERLRTALRRNGVNLSENEDEAVEVLGNLIEAVLGDPLIHTNIKPRIQRLSVPLLRTAMQDQGFFEQDAHPARQVINRLGMLGLPDQLATDETGDSLQAAVDPILDRMLADPDGGAEAFEAVLPELDDLIARQSERYEDNVISISAAREQQQRMLAERRRDDTVVPRKVAPELEPWFRRTERLAIGDSVIFGAGGESPQTRTLAWVADDHETFVFADREGRESGSVAQQELALEMLRGTAKVADSTDVPAMDRGVYQMLHNIHRSLAEEGRRDSVTGLMPIAGFESRLADAIGRAQRRGSRHAVLALNLDGFAAINENCGRSAGDSLLRKLSRLLERQISEQGCVTRAVADEFLILLEDHPFQDARRFAERQCRAIENSRVVFEGEQFPIAASIGMVPVTRAGESASAVIDNARAALAGAKRRGGNQLRVFDPDEDELPVRPELKGPEPKGEGFLDETYASVQADAQSGHTTDPASPGDGGQEGPGNGDGLADLLDEGRLVLQRQLVSSVVGDSGFKSHYEVLLGLRDADGNVKPVSDDLLTEAESSERMADVDRWVIHHALQWMSSNRREVIRSGGYAINLSAAAFADDSLLEYVVAELTESSIPPAKIIFAVTESVAIDRLSSAVGFIRAMREYGCRFSIDDFGAGHATFSYLKTLPVDFVNIDGMFVRDLADNDNDYAMVKSINEISHLMGKLTIAKYADSEATLNRLKELEVDYAQGSALSERELLQ
ncbi:MAG: diguanylate cyclase (GGDEF)-like protein [Gammaproteobacteria bacterium]